MDLSTGKRVRDNLRLVRPLGSGAMGSVWVAEHLGLRTEVAVKFVHTELAREEPMVRARFAREATAAAQIKSPHVVQIFDNGVTDDGTPFIVMELLEGETLGERLYHGGRLGVRECGELVAQVARALDKAHQLGIVHRDIKPDNVFMVQGQDGIFAKVLDFGVAKHSVWSEPGMATNPDSLVGTPAYMSRERIMADGPVTAQADLWALAACAYECLTGELPFQGASMGLICVAICQGRYRPVTERRPRLGHPIDAFFARAFHPDPAKRYATAGELAHALLVATTNAPGELQDIESALNQSGRFRMPPGALMRASRPSASGRADASDSWAGRAAAPPEPPASGPGPPPAPGERGAGGRQPPATFSGTASLRRVLGMGHRWPRAAITSLVAMCALVVVLLVALLWPAGESARPRGDTPVGPAARSPSAGVDIASSSPPAVPPVPAAAIESAERPGGGAPSSSASASGSARSTAPPKRKPQRSFRPEQVLGI